jgi:glutathione S-transferase
MILVGQYDSPLVRRVAVSLRLLGLAYEHDRRSIFGDFDAMRAINPLGRIPSLVLDADGDQQAEVLIDSSAILDHLDELAGPGHRLTPPSGPERREALRRMALATGVVEKAGATVYENQIRPAPYRWPEWIARCRTQAEGALAALDALSWSLAKPDQPAITVTCMMGWLRIADPSYLPPGRYPNLEALATNWETFPAFDATRPLDYAIPRSA